MPGRHDEAVASRILRILRVVFHLVQIQSCHEVSDTQSLPQVTLPSSGRHGQHVPAKIGGTPPKMSDIDTLRSGVCSILHVVPVQSLSNPPLTFNRAQVT